MNLKYSDFVEKCFISAEKKSIEHENGFVGTEHLLWALLDGNGVVYNVLSEMAIDINAISDKLTLLMDDYRGLSKSAEVKTLRLQRILSQAEKHALDCNYKLIPEHSVIYALVNGGAGCAVRTLSEHTYALEEIVSQVAMLEDNELKENDSASDFNDNMKTLVSGLGGTHVNMVNPEITPVERPLAPPPASISNPQPVSVQFLQHMPFFPAMQPAQHLPSSKQGLSSSMQFYSRDLTALAISKKISLPYGRDDELMNVSQILVKTKCNCPVITGSRGTGRTSLVEGLSLYLKSEGTSLTKHSRILEITRSKVLEILGDSKKDTDTLFRNFLKSSPFPANIIVFDSVMEISDEDRVTWNMLSMLNEIKKLIDSQAIRAIFITTPDEFEKIYTKDPLLSANCEKVALKSLGKNDICDILKKEIKRLSAHHKIEISDNFAKIAQELSDEFIKDGFQPSKAINLLDESCAIALTFKKTELSKEDIEKAVSIKSGLPIEKISGKGLSLKSVESTLKSQIIGQDKAIEKVCDRVRLFMAGLNNENRPLGVFFFAGPTGVGKTELARILAKELFPGDENFHRFDMSEYGQPHEIARLIGAPPGYVGYNEEGQLTGAVRRNPHSLILLDEFEKSHDKIFNIFLQVFDAGRLTDGRGEIVDLRGTLIIMTSNLGAEIAAHNYNSSEKLSPSEEKEELTKVMRGRFSMEFINRIDELILFNMLSMEDISKICSMAIDEWTVKMQKNKNTLCVAPEVIEDICQKSYDPKFGVRNMRRIIENALIIPISKKLIDEEKTSGIVINASMENGEIEITLD